MLASRLLRYFFHGLLILAPIGITAFTLYWGFVTIDNLLPKDVVPVDHPLNFLRYKGVGFVIVLVLVVLVGYLSSSFIVGRRVKKRQKEMQKALPDALDMLVVSVEAGLGLNQALVRVSEEPAA